MSHTKLCIEHIILFFLSLLFSNFLYSQPNTINGLSLWLRADSGIVVDNGNHVKIWYDLSPNQFVFLQNDTDLRPLMKDYYNKPSLFFDGNNDYFDGGNILNLSSFGNTIFVLANAINSNGTFIAKSLSGGAFNRYSLLYENNLLEFLYHDNEGVHLFTYPLDTTFALWSIWINKQNGIIKIFKNNNYLGQLNINSTFDMTSNYNFLIGAYNNSSGTTPPVLFLKGHIAEIIMYNRPLTGQEQLAVENYLMNKYAPPVKLPNDTILQSLCPFTIKPQGSFTQYIWSTGETTDSITVQHTGYYKVTATDFFGRQSTDSIFVQFPSPFHTDTTFVCLGDSALITSMLGNLVDYQWSNGSNKSYIYLKNQGWYYVTITDIFNCQSVDSIFLKIDSLSSLNLFSSDSITLCVGNALYTSNLTDITHYFWMPTNDTTQYTIVSNSDWYFVTVQNKNNCTKTDSIYVNIAGKVPIVQFNNSHTCLGQQTQFFSTSFSQDTSHITGHIWILNKNDTLQGDTISYTFTNYGYQNVELFVTTSSGCIQNLLDSIIVYPLPEVDFITSGFCERQLTRFISNTSIPFGYISDFLWQFDDGNTSTEQNPTHVYQQNGIYNVSLTLTSNEGCEKSINKEIEIKYTPQAGFIHGASCAQKQTFFTDTSKTLVYYPIIEWKWNFGNGTFSSQQNPTITYNSAGNYETKLIIKILNGCTDTITKMLQVSTSPEANFIYDSACVYQPLNAYDISQIVNGTIESRKWYIGSNFYSNHTSISIIPYQTGTLPITLIVQSNTNCFDTITKFLDVKPKPHVSFSAEPYYGTVPLTVSFLNTSELGQSYWQFGDGNISFEVNPQHVYNDTGKYTVWLKLINSFGCYDSINKVIFVVPNLNDLLVEDISLQKNSSFIEIYAKIVNLGTLPIENPILQLWVNGRFMISETLFDTLFTGDFVWYKFNGKINLQHINPTYLCVQGELSNSLTEISYSNNLFCKVLEEKEQVLNFYPNPVLNKFVIEYYLTDNQKINISIFDLIGKQIYNHQYFANKGYNRTEVDVSFLPQGIYNVKFQTQQISFKHMIIKL